MKITVAKESGFCFGVRRAFKILEGEIDRRKNSDRIFTLGSFVHNPLISEDLALKGVVSISEEQLDELASSVSPESKVTVVLRTHGVTRQLKEKLKVLGEKNPNFVWVDCTCPCVSKIHDIVEKESPKDGSENKFLVIVGDPKHPEVISIASYWVGGIVVCETLSELQKADIPEDAQIVLVAQTTQKITECKLCQNYLLKHFTNVSLYDTICRVTEERQLEVKKIAAESDLMIVLGGKNSSNTNKLFDISKEIQPNAYFVERLSELPTPSSSDVKIGITAGASTPDSLIEEAVKAMSDKVIDVEENFAEMLEQSDMHFYKTGEKVSGVVLAVNDKEIFVDLKSRYTGVISSEESGVENGVRLTDVFKKDDPIDAVIVKSDDKDGVYVMSKKQLDSRANRNKIKTAFDDGLILEGKVVEVVKKDDVNKGVVIFALSNKFFVPASQSGVSKDTDLSTLLNQTKQFRIIEPGDGRKRAVASISSVEREIRNAEIEEFWSKLEVGQVFEGVVKSITDYGVFVNIGAVDGMVHKTELSWKRFRVPSDVVSVGDKLTVRVKDFDSERKRISLGCKKDEDNPWLVFVGKYKEGDVVSVKILSIKTYGAFAEIIEGVDGLIHISQIADKKLGNPAEVLHIGDVVDAKIISIDNEEQKVSLSVRALLDADFEQSAEENQPEDQTEEKTEVESDDQPES